MIDEDFEEIMKEQNQYIEELEERLKAATDDAKEAEAYAGELEAKLAKAVEALEFYGKLIGEKHECPWHMLSDDFGEKARTTLAAVAEPHKLKGDKDE